jgi:LPXTG-motif cell wall-anchored protein
VGEAVNPAFPNYVSSFSIVGQTSNDIVLTSGADLTVIETNTQLAPFVVATPAPVVATPPPPVVVKTVTGGKLPKTGSPWYNLLLFSTGLVLLGGVGARFGKTARNK